jgi:transposase-like protein
LPPKKSTKAQSDVPKKSSGAKRRRLPRKVGGFTVNFCRDPHCSAFGIAPDPWDRRGKPATGDHGVVDTKFPELFYKCYACGSKQSVKSNVALVKEYSRLRDLNTRTNREHCRKVGCSNHRVPLSLMPSVYRSFGKTAKGDPRYQCKACRSTFSTGHSARRHKKTDKTGFILRQLVNKGPINRIAEVAGVEFTHIYEKIDYLYEQCLIFAGEREQRLSKCFRDRSVYLSTDVQTLLVNWPVKSRRGTIPLLHMATVERWSQFVVAATIDYDPDISPAEAERLHVEAGDAQKTRPMRTHARLWPLSEYQDSLLRGLGSHFTQEDRAVGGELRLPGTGSRVRGDVFSYAHMMLVRKLVGQDFRRCTFVIDAEAGLGNGIAALALRDIVAGRVDICEVAFAKGLTNDVRLELAAEGNRIREEQKALLAEEIAELRDQIPHLSEDEAIIYLNLFCRYGVASRRVRGVDLRDNGLSWPFHSKGEPRKHIRILTDVGDRSYARIARLLNRASIHPVDAYFNFARRRVAGFERGIPTASNSERIWHAYSFYRPEMIPKLATILRFYHNYMLPGADKQTPAMRLGLAKGRVYERDLFAA